MRARPLRAACLRDHGRRRHWREFVVIRAWWLWFLAAAMDSTNFVKLNDAQVAVPASLPMLGLDENIGLIVANSIATAPCFQSNHKMLC